MTPKLLKIEDHSRDSAAMRYVYPVVSRRAGGVSIGINLNPNNACNWQCIYCQVPGLTRGGPPSIDLGLLEKELQRFLAWVQTGDFMTTRVPADARKLMDVAFSGNGEPTSAHEFPEAVAVVERTLASCGLAGKLPLRLITNGSLLDRKTVQTGITRLGQAPGEVWFKVDAATAEGLAWINGVHLRPAALARRLSVCSGLAPTWVQTCLFRFDGELPDEAELTTYLELLALLAKRLAGVHLYSLARPSMQPESHRLGRVDASFLEQVAQRTRELGLTVKVSP